MPRPAPPASEIETAVIVLHYLVSHNFSKTVTAFRRDAKELLKPVQSIPAGIRPLSTIIAEYVALKEAAIRRDSYLQRNQALQEIDNIIARNSDCGIGTHHLAAQCQRPLEGPAVVLDFTDNQQATERPDGATSHQNESNNTEQHGTPDFAVHAEPGQPRLTPRKLQRKAAPKRKKCGATEDTTATPGDALASSADLLNQPINERMLEQLLAGEWQGRFAEGLASCINSRLAPHEQERLEFEASAMSPPAQQQGLDDAAMMEWVSALTEEPNMAALLEPIVAHNADTLYTWHPSEAEAVVNSDSRSSPPQQQHDSAEHAGEAMGLPSPQGYTASGGLIPEQTQQPALDLQGMVPAGLQFIHLNMSMPRTSQMQLPGFSSVTAALEPAPLVAATAVQPSGTAAAAPGRQAQEAGKSMPAPSEASPGAGEHEQQEPDDAAEMSENDSDSEDDIQVRPLDKRAVLLRNLVGSGAAEDAIESLVASLNY